MTVLSGTAEFERDLILQRTNEAAFAPWPRVRGSTASEADEASREVLKRVAAGEPTRKIALSYNVDRSTTPGSKRRTLPRFDQLRGFAAAVQKLGRDRPPGAAGHECKM